MSQDLSSASNGIRDYLVKQNCQESFVSVTVEPENTFSMRLQQSIDRAYEVTDEMIVYIPGGKFNEKTIDETLEKYRIKGIVAIGFFWSYMILKPGAIHQNAVHELGDMLIRIDLDMTPCHVGPRMITRKLHMPEDSASRWYQAIRREARLQDTLSPDGLRLNEGEKSKQPDGDLWPCYLELIRLMQGCPFFPTYINETAVTESSEYLLNVGMHWVGATGLLVDTVILEDIAKGHEGSDLESLTIHHLDCSASNLRRLVNKYRRTDDHRVLSWACRVKCQRGIESMYALQTVVDMMSDYDQELDSAAPNDRERIERRYTHRLKILAKDLSSEFAALSGAQLLRHWRVLEWSEYLLDRCHSLFSMFKKSGILRELPFLIDATETHYRELLEGADLLPSSTDFDEEEGIRRVTEILFSERQEINIFSKYLPYQRPQVHVEQIRPAGVEEPILAVPSTSIYGFVTDSGSSLQLGRDELTRLFKELSHVEDSQMAAEQRTATLQVSQENVRDDFLWKFVTMVRGPSDDIETDVGSLFAEGPIWARIPLKYLSTELIEQICLRQGLDVPRNTSRSVMVQRLARVLATPDEGRKVRFTMNNINLDWVKPVYRPKYERKLALRDQDSIEVNIYLYEIADEALRSLCRRLGGTPRSGNHPRQDHIRSILDIPSRTGRQRHMQSQLDNAGTSTISVPSVISTRVNESNLTNQQKRSFRIKFGKGSYRTVMEQISESQELLQKLEWALARTPKSLARMDPEELLEYLTHSRM